jgi:hypothetical protein
MTDAALQILRADKSFMFGRLSQARLSWPIRAKVIYGLGLYQAVTSTMAAMFFLKNRDKSREGVAQLVLIAIAALPQSIIAAAPPAPDLPTVVGWTQDGSRCDIGVHSVRIPSAVLGSGANALEIDYRKFAWATPIVWDEGLPPRNCSFTAQFNFTKADNAGWQAGFTAAELSGTTDLKNGSWVPWMNVTTEWSADGGASWDEPVSNMQPQMLGKPSADILQGKGAIVGTQGDTAWPNGTFDKVTSLDLTRYSPCPADGQMLLRVNVTGRLVRSGHDTVPDNKTELSVQGTLKNVLAATWKKRDGGIGSCDGPDA